MLIRLSKNQKHFLSWSFLVIPVICLLAGCRGVEAKKAEEPSSSSPSLEWQLRQTQHALTAKEEENAALGREFAAARQARQREQEEMKKQFDEVRALLEEKIAALSKQLSSAKSAASAGRREKDQFREMKAAAANAEEQRVAAVQELQNVQQLLASKEREAADLAKQVEAAKRVPPPKVPQPTKTPEPPKTVSERHPIFDKLSGVPPWLWIASAILNVLLLYLVVRQANLSRDRNRT
jgi:hypothetical protein